jgi:hypothetical protein
MAETVAAACCGTRELLGDLDPLPLFVLLCDAHMDSSYANAPSAARACLCFACPERGAKSIVRSDRSLLCQVVG